LPEVIKIRNRFAHRRGSDHAVKGAIRDLNALVYELRNLFRGTWGEGQVLLVSPKNCQQMTGSSNNEVKVLVGSNRRFLNESFSLSACLNIERLHLMTRDHPYTLQLLPLIRLGPAQDTPYDTFYFYNKLAKNQASEDQLAKYVSYHEQGDGTLDLSPGDTGGLFKFFEAFEEWSPAE